jgi:hypothetical protein
MLVSDVVNRRWGVFLWAYLILLSGFHTSSIECRILKRRLLTGVWYEGMDASFNATVYLPVSSVSEDGHGRVGAVVVRFRFMVHPKKNSYTLIDLLYIHICST